MQVQFTAHMSVTFSSCFFAPATLVQDGGAKNGLRPDQQAFIRYRQKVVDVGE